MTTYNKTTLKTFFEQGDIPSGTDYGNLIDSQVNIVETGTQVMGGALSPTELITARVSATNVNVTGTLAVAGIFSAGNTVFNSVTTSAAIVTGALTGNTASFSGIVSGTTLNLSGDVSAATGTVYASAVRSTNGVLSSTGIVSAAGTTQGTAAVLTNIVNRGKGIADGVTTGFTPLNNRTGLIQYLFNEGASANLWPPTGGTINGLAANAAFPLVASAMVTIVHLTASAMAAK